MIAHQWRQPLSTVTLNISNLQIKYMLGDEIERSELDKTLEDINETIVYLSETIDDFQTYFHPNKEIVHIEVHELLQRAVNFVIPRLKNTKIEILVASSESIYLETYVNEFIQVILNIINNAVDVLIKDEIENPKIKLYVSESQEHIEISIEDNARGIHPDHLVKVFDPYFSTKGKNGTGLGLYMSQMIVQKQFNGNINVESSGCGSKFSIYVQKVLDSEMQ